MYRMEINSLPLSDLNIKATLINIKEEFKKYRMCKYLVSVEEASITASYNERFHGPTNTTSDQTAQVALRNVEIQERRRRYCEWIEINVATLPPEERFLIERRYMAQDADYITDQRVYQIEFDPPRDYKVFDAIRTRAIHKLSVSLGIAVMKES